MTPTRFLIAPDSFKGSLSSSEAACAISQGIELAQPDSLTEAYPMADGGEGSSSIAARSLNSLDTQKVELEVIGPEGNTVTGFYYINKQHALIELAAASGFMLSKDPARSAPFATTFGTGELIKDAILKGATEISLFLGGSATTDGGVGIAKALGMEFFDANNSRLIDARTSFNQNQNFPGEQLARISKIEDSKCLETLDGIRISAIVDVNNPLCGPVGAAAVYGPQKGNSPTDIESLDSGLINLKQVVSKKYGTDFSLTPGVGAAGGAGFGVLALLHGTLKPGAAFFLDLISFNEKLKQIDCVVTGEGKADSQSTQGKLLGEILTRASNNLRVVSFVGINELPSSILDKYPKLEVQALKTGLPLDQAFDGLVDTTRHYFAKNRIT